ncbi:MAG: FISUMP domain-containing protein [Marinifilaceae bacterium]
MKKLLILTGILSLFLIFTKCDKETVEQEKKSEKIEGTGIKLVKEQNIVTLTTTDVLEITSLDTITYSGQKFPIYEVSLEGQSEEIKQLVPGSVIYVPNGNKGGTTMLVSEVSQTGGVKSTKGAISLTIKGIQATLDMYFNGEHNKLRFATPENRSKSNTTIANKLTDVSPKPLNDISVKFQAATSDLSVGFSSSTEKLFMADIEGKLWSKDDSYISIGGSMSVHPSFDFFMEYEPELVQNGSQKYSKILGWLEAAVVPDAVMALYKDKDYYLGNMKQLKANVYTDVDNELTFNIHMKKKFTKKKEVPLGTFTVPTVPVSSQVEVSFEIDFEALGVADLTVSSKDERDLVVGVNLGRDLPDPVWYSEFKSNRIDSLTLKSKVELTTGISLVLETEIYALGILGPEISLEAFIEATASVNPIVGTNTPGALNWKLSADGGLRGTSSLNLSAFHIDPATWKVWSNVIVEVKKNIYHAPAYLKVEKGNEQTGPMGQSLPLPVTIGVYGSDSTQITWLPVPVYFETKNGNCSPSGLKWTNNGLASTNWTLDSKNESQILNAYLKENGNKKGEIIINATATATTNTPPVPNFTISPETGNTNTVFMFDASGSYDNETPVTDLMVRWDFDSDGTFDTDWSPTKTVTHVYNIADTYTVNLEVKDASEAFGTSTKTVTVSDGDTPIIKGSFTDSRDGKTYQTVTIGNQTWFAENLAYEIPGKHITKDSLWKINRTYDGWCYYDNDKSNGSKYGILYQWEAAKAACPEGWHLPTTQEWQVLVDHLVSNGYNYDGSVEDSKVGKSISATYGWQPSEEIGTVGYDQETNNRSGFSALPGGSRVNSGPFMTGPTGEYKKYSAYWWTSGERVRPYYGTIGGEYIFLKYEHYTPVVSMVQHKSFGYSVRCIKN